MAVARVTIVGVSPYSPGKYHDTPKLEKESHDDFEKRTWRERCHYDAKGHLFIPPMAFKNSLSAAAKRLGMQVKGKGKATYTKHFEGGVLVLEPLVLATMKDSVAGEWLFVPSDGKRGSGSRVKKCFAVVPEWGGVVEFHVLDETITKDVFQKHIEECGKFTGIGRFRPANNGYYGRFSVKSVEWSA